MTTLITIGNSDGQRRCDAKCYDAVTPVADCDCCCGGRNHGAGKDRAMQQTADQARAWLKAYGEKFGRDGLSMILGEPAQGRLEL